MHSSRFVFLLLAASLSCGPPRALVPPPPSRVGRAPALAPLAPLAPPHAPSCLIAATLRARVPKNVESGWLDRALREMDRADALCPSSMRETLATKVQVWLDLGDHELARAALPRLSSFPDLTRLEREVLAKATATLEHESKRSPDEAAKRAARARTTRGLEAYERGDAATATRELRAAWEVLRPDGEVLRLATQAALDEAHGVLTPELRRGFDRSLHELEAATKGRVAVETPSAFTSSSSVAWSRDGRWIAVGAGRTISVFDVGRRRITAQLRGHAGAVLSVALSPDGKTLASSSEDGTARLWNVDGDPRRSLHWGDVVRGWVVDESPVACVAFSPDGHTLASASKGGVRLWRLDGSLLRKVQEPPVHALSVAFSPDGKTLASAGRSWMHLWDVSTASGRGFSRADELGGAVAFAPDGQSLAWGSSAEVQIRSLTGALIRTMSGPFDRPPTSASYSRDGKWLAVGGARLWELPEGAKKPRMTEDLRGTSAAFSPDGRYLAVGRGPSLTVVATAGTARFSTTSYTEPVHALALADGGRTLASGGSNVRTWRAASDAGSDHLDRSVGYGSPVTSLAFSPDARTLAANAWNGVSLWRDGKGPTTLRGRGPTLSVAFSPDGTLAAGTGAGPIQLWDVTGAAGKLLRELGRVSATRRARGDGASALAFSPDAQTLAAGYIGSIRLWNTSGKLKGELSFPPGVGRVTSLALSPDGKTLASGECNFTRSEGNDDYRFVAGWSSWRTSDLERGAREPAKSTSSLSESELLPVVAFSSDGKTLAFAEGPSVSLWNHEAPPGSIESEAPLRLEGHTDNVKALAAHGKTLVAGDAAGDIRVYSLPNGAHLGTLRAMAHEDSGYVLTNEAIEVLGADSAEAREHLVCSVGGRSYPFELCAGRFETPGLLRVVLLGEPLDSVL